MNNVIETEMDNVEVIESFRAKAQRESKERLNEDLARYALKGKKNLKFLRKREMPEVKEVNKEWLSKQEREEKRINQALKSCHSVEDIDRVMSRV